MDVKSAQEDALFIMTQNAKRPRQGSKSCRTWARRVEEELHGGNVLHLWRWLLIKLLTQPGHIKVACHF